MLQEETDFENKLAYNPSIFIDFDSRVLISNYAEPESFEAFVPKGWKGEYKDFSNKIPINQQYWINSNGKNLIVGKG